MKYQLNPYKILNEVQRFYENLWGTNNKNIDTDFQTQYVQMKTAKIDKENSDDLENFISEKEIAVQQLNKESSPGSDGLTSLFLQNFSLSYKKRRS